MAIGFGCTPTNCKGGPYGDNDSANYNVWSNYGGNFGPSYNTPSFYAPPPFVPTMCDPKDSLCVMGGAASSVAYQQAILMSQADYNYQGCIQQLDQATCRARWPVGYAGNVPYMNLSPTAQQHAFDTPSSAAQQLLSNPVNQDIPGLAKGAILNAPVRYLDTLGDWVNQLINSNQVEDVNPTVQATEHTTSGEGGTGSAVNKLLSGAKSIISPEEWGDIFKSGDLLLIAGLVGVPVLAYSFMGKK